MSTFPFRMPENVKAALAAHAGSQAETERYFTARAARSSPGQALEILARAGQGNQPEPGDELPPDPAP